MDKCFKNDTGVSPKEFLLIRTGDVVRTGMPNGKYAGTYVNRAAMMYT